MLYASKRPNLTFVYQILSHGLPSGWDGVLRLIWEGDAYPIHVRRAIKELDEAQDTIEKESALLSLLEEGLERANLDSIDSADESTILALWESNVPILDLRKQLALLSDKLDKVAAKIDAVTEQTQRDRKRALSKRAVDLMARMDMLVDFVGKARPDE